ncbi:hypothetical protein [Thalassobellus citreus]|uniref:hypothetical protein n=1 Tax=Thalassobellus citreus TaxID=3367752 RepID=UPI0037B5A6B1
MKIKELPYLLYKSATLITKSVNQLKHSNAETVHITIRSLLTQKCLPEKIILWLNNTLSKQSTKSAQDPIHIIGTQSISLKKRYTKQDYNRTQWLQITNHFNLKLNFHDKKI